MRQQLPDVTSWHSNQVWEVETVEAVTATAGQGQHASKDYLTLTHTPDRLGVLGWVDAADSAWGCGACLCTELLAGSACCLVNCNKSNQAFVRDPIFKNTCMWAIAMQGCEQTRNESEWWVQSSHLLQLRACFVTIVLCSVILY